MKKTLDTKPGQTVEVGARRAAKLIKAAIETRSGQTIGEITRDLFAQIQSGKPREIGTDDDLEVYPDFRFDDTFVAAGAGQGYFNMFRALRAASEGGQLSRFGRDYDHADWDYFAFNLSAKNGQGAVLADAVYTPRPWDERN
jgi:hypothetical protein